MTHENIPSAITDERKAVYKGYWSYLDNDDNLFDGQFSTEAEAIAHAENAFCERMEDQEGFFSEEVELVFCHDNDAGEPVILHSTKTIVEFDSEEKTEHEEHFNQKDYV